MACGGCSKGRPKIYVNKKGIVSKAASGNKSGSCPKCGSAMRYVHKLDRRQNKIARMLYCIRPACRFQQPG